MAHVERETGVPVWRTGTTADVSCGELAGNLLDHVFDGVVCEVACGGKGREGRVGGMEEMGDAWGEVVGGETGCGDTIPKQNPERRRREVQVKIQSQSISIKGLAGWGLSYLS